MRFTPRSYQLAAVHGVLRAWGEMAQDPDNPVPMGRRTLINAATGSGKSPTAVAIIQGCISKGARVLYCADRNELVKQPVRTLYDFAGIIAAIDQAEQRASLHSKVVVASLQTIARRKQMDGIRYMLPRLERYSKTHFDYIIIDEAHRNVEGAAEVMNYFDKAKCVGMTATPFRSGLADLSSWYDSVAFNITRSEVVKLGYLVPLKVVNTGISLDVTGVHQSMGTYGMDYKADEVASAIEPYFNSIAEAIKRDAAGYQVLSFLPLIRTSEKFVTRCLDAGITSRHCDGATKDRPQILESFERREFQHLSNPQTFSTGTDFITADALNVLRCTRSLGLYQQMTGRIVRPLKGIVDRPEMDTPEKRREAIAASRKPHGLVLDFLWQYKSLGVVGPESLAANCAEDAQEIAERIRRKRTPQDLEEIAKIVQADRENKLKKRLDWAARQASGLFDAGTFAALAHNQPILEYTPFKDREKWPVSSFSKLRLTKAGIDPETVTCEGHAEAIIRQVNIRRHHRLPELPIIQKLDFEKAERILKQQQQTITHP